MNYVFENNMFSEYSKQELKEMFEDIRKFEEKGLISNCFMVEEVKIKSIFKRFSHPDAFNLAEKEFFDEIARRYFSENEKQDASKS